MFEKLTDFFYSLYERFYSMPFLTEALVAFIFTALVVLCFWLWSKKRKKNKRAVENIIDTAVPPQQSNSVVANEVKVPLPVAKAEIKFEPVAETVSQSPQLKANILIIDDDPIMLLAISSILNRSGYNLITARDGKEAFEALEKGGYDLVVTDLMMPYANGLEVVSFVRNDINKRHVGIIVCSSVGNEDTITEAFRLGADDYLKKPIKTEELLLRIKKLLDRRMDNPKLVTKKTVRAYVW